MPPDSYLSGNSEFRNSMHAKGAAPSTTLLVREVAFPSFGVFFHRTSQMETQSKGNSAKMDVMSFILRLKSLFIITSS